MHSYSSRMRREHRDLRQEHRRMTVDELSQRPRMQSLALFLGCDPAVVAEGIVEAVQRDPVLRVQRI